MGCKCADGRSWSSSRIKQSGTKSQVLTENLHFLEVLLKVIRLGVFDTKAEVRSNSKMLAQTLKEEAVEKNI